MHEAGLEKKFYEGFVEQHREDTFGPVAMIRALDGGTTACLNLTGLEMLRSLIGKDGDSKQNRKMIFSRTTYQKAQVFIEEEAAKIAQVTVSDGAVAMDVVAALEARTGNNIVLAKPILPKGWAQRLTGGRPTCGKRLPVNPKNSRNSG